MESEPPKKIHRRLFIPSPSKQVFKTKIPIVFPRRTTYRRNKDKQQLDAESIPDDNATTFGERHVEPGSRSLSVLSSPKRGKWSLGKALNVNMKCTEPVLHGDTSESNEGLAQPATRCPVVHSSPKKNWTVTLSLKARRNFKRRKPAPVEHQSTTSDETIVTNVSQGTQKATVLDEEDSIVISDTESSAAGDLSLSKDVDGQGDSFTSDGETSALGEVDQCCGNNVDVSDNSSAINSAAVDSSVNGMSDGESEIAVEHIDDTETTNSDCDSISNCEHEVDSDNTCNGISDDSNGEDMDGTDNFNVQHQDDRVDRPLFDREYLQKRIVCASNISVGEGVLMATTLAERHGFSGVALSDIMQMCNVLMGTDRLPATAHKLRKIFKEPLDHVVYHVYCKVCAYELGAKCRNDKDQIVLCPNCQEERCVTLSGGNFFVILNIKEQIKILMESEVVKNFQSSREAGTITSESIAALNQSILYNKLVSSDVTGFNKLKDFTFNFNIDGASMFHTSKDSLYPIQMMIDELPSVIRHDKIVLAGLWYGKGPVMEVFMKPFIAEINVLSREGVKWVKSDGIESFSKFFPLCCCVDSVARPQILNHSQFNAYAGCSLCLHPGFVPPGTKTMKYPYNLNANYRTPEGRVTDMRNALNTSKVQHGVKGPTSVLEFVPRFNTVWGFPPDYMHGALLGVAESLTGKLLSTTHARYYLGRPTTSHIINGRLQSIKPPDVVNRLPESLDKKSLWHASDWKWWLLLYSIPCLSGILLGEYLNHLALLVEGITLLLKTEVRPQDINKARSLLDKFVCKMENMYGLSAMTFNVHSLVHYADAVKMCGPLWITSSFPYESKMQEYRKKIGGSKGVAIQIVEREVRKQYLPAMEKHIQPVNRHVSSFLEVSHTSKKRYKSSTMVGNCVLVGNGTLRNLSAREQDLLGVSLCLDYTTLIYNGKKYCSTKVQLKRRRNDVVQLTRERYGFIQNIFVLNVDGQRVCKIIVKILDCEQLQCGSTHMSHIKKCKENLEATSICVEVNEIVSPCIFMSFGTGSSYLCLFPNTLEVQ